MIGVATSQNLPRQQQGYREMVYGERQLLHHIKESGDESNITTSIIAFGIYSLIAKIPELDEWRLDNVGIKTNVITLEWGMSAYFYPHGVHHPFRQDFNENSVLPEILTGYGETLNEAYANLKEVIEKWAQTLQLNGQTTPGIPG